MDVNREQEQLIIDGNERKYDKNARMASEWIGTEYMNRKYLMK